jgi:NAD(P)-dependent dehydrogenase (short-subunit alcohol dehydrogenase family)
MRLAGKTAVIAGGANGIGAAISLLFAHEGARVLVADRDAAAAEALAERLRAEPGEGAFVAADLSREDDVAALFRQADEQLGGADLLVHCVGIAVSGSAADTDPERWQRVIDVNLSSVYLCCRAAIPAMLRRGAGAIVNVASIQGLFGYPHYAAYAASKSGIIGLSRQIAVDYGPRGIRCNTISPGAITTQLGENSARLEPQFTGDPSAGDPSAGDPSAGEEARSPRSAFFLRSGVPEDVAYAALFLASDEARHVTGHNLVVDGGATCRVE